QSLGSEPSILPVNRPRSNKKAAFFKGGFGLAKLDYQTTLWPAILPIQRLRIHKREDSPACLDRCRDRHGLMSWFGYANHGCCFSIPSTFSLPQLRRLVKKKLKIDKKKLVLPHELSLHTLKYPIKISEPDANRIDGAHGGVRRSSQGSPRNLH